ncbi:MAG: 3-oxoacyl-ACP reductase FabG [Candidatus Omnitrophica bacterium]|nr:3-oxoacyl-ACP reductase FabG [Candidatus Omnitrophota bacterium]
MPNNLFDLTGKTALVTGASRGLGQAMALALARAGADVALNARQADSLKETAEEIRRLGRKAVVAAGDVSDEAAAKQVVEQAQRELGRIDVLINNAGVWEGSYLVRLNKEDWDRVVKVNLTGVYLMARAVGKVMLKQKSGKIINVASILGFKASPQSLAYAATKAGVIQMTRVMAVELGPAGITVNAIAPGFFDTDMTKRYQQEGSREALEAYTARIPLRRRGKPEDLSGLVVFLASKAADHITGQTHVIDGGESLV